MGILDRFRKKPPSKDEVISAYLPVMADHIYKQTQDGFEDFITLWETGSRIRAKRSIENKCECTALVMSMQISNWAQSISDSSAVRKASEALLISLSSVSQYSLDMYQQRLSAYLRHCKRGEKSINTICNQFFFLIEPDAEYMEVWNRVGEYIKSGKEMHTLQSIVLFERIFNILDIHKKFIEDVNRT